MLVLDEYQFSDGSIERCCFVRNVFLPSKAITSRVPQFILMKLIVFVDCEDLYITLFGPCFILREYNKVLF